MKPADQIASKLRELGLDSEAAKFDGGTAQSRTDAGDVAGPKSTVEIRPHYWPQLKRHSPEGPVILVGASASGKTWAVQQLAKEEGLELWMEQAHRDLGTETIRGTQGLNEKGTYFNPGNLIRSLTIDRGAFFLDEINMADPAVESLLNHLLDKPGEIRIPETGERYSVPDTWRFFGAMNREYVGTQPLNQALKSRCVIVECHEYAPEDEVALIIDKVPDIPRSDAESIVDIANAVRTARANGDHEFDMCLRTLWQLARELVGCGDPLVAFERIVLPKVGDEHLYADVRSGLREAALLILSENI